MSSDPEVQLGSGPEAVQPGLEVQQGNQATRRKPSVFRDRKLSVVDPKAAVVEAAELSEADRRLAEMGYVQVCLLVLPLNSPPNVSDES